MANDHDQFKAHHQRRSGGGGGGHDDDDDQIVSLLKKYYASSIPLPPVPHANPRLLQTPQKPSIPVIDPQTIPAKQGLNNWGAFTGRGNSASKSGLFGLGPLLFRHGCGDDSKAASSPSPLTGRDLVEMEELQRNDPDSFDPMRAVWWVKFDEDDDDDDVVEDGEASPVQREQESKGKETENVGSLRNCQDGLKYQNSMSGAVRDGLPRQSSLDDDVAFDKSTVTHSSGDPLHTSTPGDVHQHYSLDTRLPPVSTKHLDAGATLSNAVVAGPDGHSVFAPPMAVSYSNPPLQINSGQPHGRQQHKHHHPHETQTGTSPTDLYVMIQDLRYLPSDIPTTMPSFSFSTQPHHTQHHQLAYTNYPTINSSSSSILQPPPHQETTNLVLCLAPSCKARFSTEAQLYVHFQAVHASSNQSDRDDLHQSYTSPSISLACSWTSCRARGFTSNNALMWHVKAEHLLQCPLPACCDGMFRSKKQAEEHARKRLSCL